MKTDCIYNRTEQYIHTKSESITAVIMTSYVTQCSLIEIYHFFRGDCCFHLHGREILLRCYVKFLTSSFTKEINRVDVLLEFFLSCTFRVMFLPLYLCFLKEPVQNDDSERVAIYLCLQLDRWGRDKDVNLEYASHHFKSE